MQVQVECYAGHKADERPRRFSLDGRSYEVRVVLDSWYGPADEHFRVLADDGHIYVLRHRREGQEDHWSLEAYRRSDAVPPGFDPGTPV